MSNPMFTARKISLSDRYGVTEAKKAELDALQMQVTNQTDYVEQQQAIVTSLTAKVNKFQTFLNEADATRSKALSNKELMVEVVNNARKLMQGSKLGLRQASESDIKIKEIAIGINKVIDMLIYSAEIITKLSNLVTRQRALNPLISEELVANIAQAGTNANNAVALTLVALQSAFASQATSFDTESISSLELVQAKNLFYKLTGKDVEGKPLPAAKNKSIKSLLDQAYKTATSEYDKSLNAFQDASEQLETAQANLDKATVKLASLNAGLAAANAAALA